MEGQGRDAAGGQESVELQSRVCTLHAESPVFLRPSIPAPLNWRLEVRIRAEAGDSGASTADFAALSILGPGCLERNDASPAGSGRTIKRVQAQFQLGYDSA